MPNTPARDRDDLPALLGGSPIRPQGPPDWPGSDPAVTAAVQSALADGSWGKYHGPHTSKLTDVVAQTHGGCHVMLCSSGTVAMELALRGLRVGPGDEVILAAYDFRGNFQNVLTVGATPVLIDIHPTSGNLDPSHLAAAISKRTKAIIVSHLHGGVVSMPDVVRIARQQTPPIPVIEDAAQMPGATIAGKTAGTWGDVGILSFGGSKLLSAGRGGAVITSLADVAQRIKLYTQRGNDAYPLSELQAVALLPQCERLAEFNRRRAASANRLRELLANVSGLRPFENAVANSQPGYYKFGLQYDPVAFGGLSRDLFAEAMRADGIALDAGFRSLHLTHASSRFRPIGTLTHATDADARVLTLHHPILLEGPEALRQFVDAVERIRRNATILQSNRKSKI
ncbi:MAG: aminotransferase class V-fold PLP-dependent enzyme [Planctomycetales bacterium]|nr:aminotransferase class V-fold PLP-dependent enzyme [Planctomycetales bacterium]